MRVFFPSYTGFTARTSVPDPNKFHEIENLHLCRLKSAIQQTQARFALFPLVVTTQLLSHARKDRQFSGGSQTSAFKSHFLTSTSSWSSSGQTKTSGSIGSAETAPTSPKCAESAHPRPPDARAFPTLAAAAALGQSLAAQLAS